MLHLLTVLLTISLFFPSLLKAFVVKEPVINIYVSPEENTEINTQAIYGSALEVAEKREGWWKVRLPDGEEGWIQSFRISHNSSFENNANLRPVKSLFANVFRTDDTAASPPLLTLPYGAKIKLINTVDTGERWVRIELASGESAWIQRGDVDFSPKTKTLEETIQLSKKFLGLPYAWGGVSTYGMDCSGFMQMLFKEMGLLLPRNSRQQVQSDLFSTVQRSDLQQGDLIFFTDGKKIHHVGLYLGNDEFIHAGVRDNAPLVMISNLNTSKYTYSLARRIKQ